MKLKAWRPGGRMASRDGVAAGASRLLVLVCENWQKKLLSVCMTSIRADFSAWVFAWLVFFLTGWEKSCWLAMAEFDGKMAVAGLLKPEDARIQYLAKIRRPRSPSACPFGYVFAQKVIAACPSWWRKPWPNGALPGLVYVQAQQTKVETSIAPSAQAGRGGNASWPRSF
jgi:hypothetical protein